MCNAITRLRKFPDCAEHVHVAHHDIIEISAIAQLLLEAYLTIRLLKFGSFPQYKMQNQYPCSNITQVE